MKIQGPIWHPVWLYCVTDSALISKKSLAEKQPFRLRHPSKNRGTVSTSTPNSHVKQMIKKQFKIQTSLALFWSPFFNPNHIFSYMISIKTLISKETSLKNCCSGSAACFLKSLRKSTKIELSPAREAQNDVLDFLNKINIFNAAKMQNCALVLARGSF